MASVIAGVGAGFLGNFISSSATTNGNYYDFWNTWYQLSPELTDSIDKVLIDDPRGVVKTKKIVSRGRTVPGKGYHYFYYHREGWSIHYITFEKKTDEHGDDYYMAYVSTFQGETFREAMRKVFETPRGLIRTISIDTSRGYSYAMFTEKIYKPPKENQTKALDLILHEYGRDLEVRNVSIMISGVRGTGKTWLARLLKYRMEREDDSIMVRCYDNFNPTYYGCNVETLVLAHASKFTPVILLINEFDVSMKSVYETDHSGDRDSRLLHTKDIQSFHDFMDRINESQHCINLFTTEKPLEYFYRYRSPDGETFNSMIRPGRIDKFLELTEDGCVMKAHHEIPGYS